MTNRIRHKRGFTLLELLVVIFIISILMAVAIPVLRPPMSAKAIREATRMVNSSLAISRTKALEARRPWGIMFEPLPSNESGCVILHYVYVPPPYAGDTTASRLIVRDVTVPTPPATSSSYGTLRVDMPETDVLMTTGTADTADDNVRPGDALRLNFQGHRFQVLAIRNVDGDTWDLDLYSDTVIVWPRAVDPSSFEPSYAFQFIHRPKKSALAPVQLPNRAAVDVAASGIGDSVFMPSASNPVIITFSPSGQVDLVYHDGQPFGGRLYDSLHLMIGKPGAYGVENFMDLENLWVSVASQTGQVKSSENAYVADVAPDPFEDTDVRKSRKHARSGQGMGG